MGNLQNCKICGGKICKVYYVKERMLNRGDVFKYGLCKACGTLQLLDNIDISEYYQDCYYSFFSDVTGNRKVAMKRHKLSIFEWILINTYWFSSFNEIITRIAHVPNGIMAIRGTKVTNESDILDVGGGSGQLSWALKKLGFGKCTTIDKFCRKTNYPVMFRQCEITEYEGTDQFDLIMFNNSFEHMDNPDEVLRSANRLLKKHGRCTILIPISENIALKKYGECWYQIDSPRHYFLYTKRAMKMLGERNGLKLIKTVWSAGCNQYTLSEEYVNSKMSWGEIIASEPFRKYSKRKKLWIWIKTIISNLNHTGDEALFVFDKCK